MTESDLSVNQIFKTFNSDIDQIRVTITDLKQVNLNLLSDNKSLSNRISVLENQVKILSKLNNLEVNTDNQNSAPISSPHSHHQDLSVTVNTLNSSDKQSVNSNEPLTSCSRLEPETDKLNKSPISNDTGFETRNSPNLNNSGSNTENEKIISNGISLLEVKAEDSSSNSNLNHNLKTENIDQNNCVNNSNVNNSKISDLQFLLNSYNSNNANNGLNNSTSSTPLPNKSQQKRSYATSGLVSPKPKKIKSENDINVILGTVGKNVHSNYSNNVNNGGFNGNASNTCTNGNNNSSNNNSHSISQNNTQTNTNSGDKNFASLIGQVLSNNKDENNDKIGMLLKALSNSNSNTTTPSNNNNNNLINSNNSNSSTNGLNFDFTKNTNTTNNNLQNLANLLNSSNHGNSSLNLGSNSGLFSSPSSVNTNNNTHTNANTPKKYNTKNMTFNGVTTFCRGSDTAIRMQQNTNLQSEEEYTQFRRDLMERVVQRKIEDHIRNCSEGLNCGLHHLINNQNDDIWSACRLSSKSPHSSVIARILKCIKKEMLNDEYAFEHIQGSVSIRGMPTASVNKVKEVAARATRCYIQALGINPDIENVILSHVLINIKA